MLAVRCCCSTNRRTLFNGRKKLSRRPFRSIRLIRVRLLILRSANLASSTKLIERLTLDRGRIIGAERIHGILLGLDLGLLRLGGHGGVVDGFGAGDVGFDGGPLFRGFGVGHAILLVTREGVVRRRTGARRHGGSRGGTGSGDPDGGDGRREGKHCARVIVANDCSFFQLPVPSLT